MPSEISLFLAAPPQLVSKASSAGLPLLSMAYRLGQGGHLYRSGPRQPLPGSLMGIDDSNFDGHGNPSIFCREVLQEAAACRFAGIFCQFERPLGPVSREILQILNNQCLRRGLDLWIAEQPGSLPENSRVVISSAISGGTLTWRLEEAARRFGAHRIVLGLERTTMEFSLPSPTGAGVPLSQKELKRKLTCHSPAVFFSQALCAQYFVYTERESGPRFVLFDNAPSLRQKLQIAQSLGVTVAVAAYPQVGDWMDEILSWEEICIPSS